MCAYQGARQGFHRGVRLGADHRPRTGSAAGRPGAGDRRATGARAQAAGTFRADIERADLIVLLTGNAGVVASAGPDAASASRRYVAHMLRSFVTDATR
ncbi:hypothetical protein [Micromonospora rubida]